MPTLSPHQQIQSLGEIPYVGEPFRCPHCAVTIQPTPEIGILATLPDSGLWFIWKNYCAACRKYIFQIGFLAYNRGGTIAPVNFLKRAEIKYFVYPKTAQRPPPPKGVPPDILADYLEASLVLDDSPKASAALSRRCLQHALRSIIGVKAADLWKEIDEVIASGTLPSNISDELDKVRVIGNFAAHPNKSTTTGAILDVEPGEAEWNLVVLEDLFDFYYVRLAKSAQLKTEINKKLVAAGKKPLP
jgi:Domain of unknown function (DUF4145)